jgi:hypothetical protein
MSVLDRSAKRNVIHKNAASRHKSRLMRHLNAVGGAKAEAPKKRRAPAKKAPGRTGAAKTATKRASKAAKK